MFYGGLTDLALEPPYLHEVKTSNENAVTARLLKTCGGPPVLRSPPHALQKSVSLQNTALNPWRKNQTVKKPTNNY